MEPISLSDAVAEIRRELKLALAAADDEIRLAIKEVELELALDISRQRSGGIGLSVLEVVKADGSTNRTTTQQHRIKLLLHPSVSDKDGSNPRELNLSDSDRL